MVTFIDCIFFLMASMAADVECQARSGGNDYDRSRSKIKDLKQDLTARSSSVVSKGKIGLERTITIAFGPRFKISQQGPKSTPSISHLRCRKADDMCTSFRRCPSNDF